MMQLQQNAMHDWTASIGNCYATSCTSAGAMATLYSIMLQEEKACAFRHLPYVNWVKLERLGLVGIVDFNEGVEMRAMRWRNGR